MNDVLANTINDAPVFPDEDPETEGRQTAQERMVGENVPVEFGGVEATALVRDVGPPLVATNDDGGALTYSLGGPDAASFGHHQKLGPAADQGGPGQRDERHLHGNRDGHGLTRCQFNHYGHHQSRPTWTRCRSWKATHPEEYAENGTGVVATFRATDPEGESITWTLVSALISAAFSIENGVLRFKSSPDYEMTADEQPTTITTYEVTIQASDGGQDTTATKEVTVDGSPTWTRTAR